MSKAIRTLGAYAFYPLREAPRIGGVYLVDRGAADPRAHLSPTDETNLLLTEALVPDFEQARRARASLRPGARFPQSDAAIAAALQPPGNGAGHYRQAGTPATITPAARRRASARPAAAEEQNLALAAFPGFTLASVDEASLAANIPTQVASFLGGIGLRHSTYLKMEAEGVEYADLPFDTVLEILRNACGRRGVPPFVNGATGAGTVTMLRTAGRKMEADWYIRVASAVAEGRPPPPPFQPGLALVTRIYYLRGIRFIIDDSRASSAIAQLSLANRLPSGVTAPAIPAITITNTAPATPGRTAASDAQIDALAQSIQSLRNALSSSTQTGFASSVARATARGVELVDVFDRPLAFGYAALWAKRLAFPSADTAQADPNETWAQVGLSGVCDFAGGLTHLIHHQMSHLLAGMAQLSEIAWRLVAHTHATLRYF